jgi:phage FluMu protein Com
MPIEFRCSGCSKLLRTPDASAGKKAKCPQCGAILDVPAEIADELPVEPASEPPPVESPPPQPFRPSPPEVSPNPYVSPTVPAPTPPPSFGELQHTTISFDDVFQKSWAVFKTQIGLCVVAAVVYLAIMIPIGALSSIVRVAGQAQEDPALIVVGVAIEQVVGFFANTFFVLGMLIFGINLMRDGHARVSEIFSAARFYLRGLGLFCIIYLIWYGLFILCLLPPVLLAVATQSGPLVLVVLLIFGPLALGVTTYALLRMSLASAFLVDQQTGITESLRLSDQFMTGNKFTAFIIWIVAILAGTVVACTCVGLVFVVPYLMALLTATIYLLATGQPVYEPSRV